MSEEESKAFKEGREAGKQYASKGGVGAFTHPPYEIGDDRRYEWMKGLLEDCQPEATNSADTQEDGK